MNYNESKQSLFHRVVIESGAPTSRAVRPPNATVHEDQFRDLLRAVDCPKNCPEADIMPFLRSVPYEKICASQTAVFDKYNPSLRWAFQPVIDGDIIPRPPLETWLSGKWHHVPIMTGFNHNEGSLYVNKNCNKSSEFTTFFAELLPLLNATEISQLDELYPDPLKHEESQYKEARQGVGAQYKRIEAAYANYAYVAPVRQTAEFASPSCPVYLYQWALETSILEGARHGDNMRYEACDPNIMKISSTQADISRCLNGYITSFIATGDPSAIKVGDTDAPVWEKYTTAKPVAMVFGLKNKELVGGETGPSSEMMADDWEKIQSEFWWSKVEISQK